MNDDTKIHERQVYGLLDLFGDLGGVIEIAMLFFHLVLGKLQEHDFLIKAIERLYCVTETHDVVVEKQQTSGKEEKRGKKPRKK